MLSTDYLSSPNASAHQPTSDCSIQAGKRCVDNDDANNRDPEHHRYDARSACTVTIDLLSNWEPLPTPIDYIFDMYNTWSTDFDADAQILLPRVGYITCLGPYRLRLPFYKQAIEEFLGDCNAHHTFVSASTTVVVCRNNVYRQQCAGVEWTGETPSNLFLSPSPSDYLHLTLLYPHLI